MASDVEREVVLRWLEVERQLHQDGKFDDVRAEHDAFMVNSGLAHDGYWYNQINMYFHRASVLGLENHVGRQAAAKGVATALAMLESVFRVYGNLPAPGLPSGEVQPWE